MAIQSVQANKGLFYKVLSKVTNKDYYKTETGATIKADKGQGTVSYNTDTGEITCDGLQNAIIKGDELNNKINVTNSSNVKVYGGDADDELAAKYSDTVELSNNSEELETSDSDELVGAALKKTSSSMLDKLLQIVKPIGRSAATVAKAAAAKSTAAKSTAAKSTAAKAAAARTKATSSSASRYNK